MHVLQRCRALEELNEKLETSSEQATTQAEQERTRARLLEQRLEEISKKQSDLERIKGILAIFSFVCGCLPKVGLSC